jgi:hypothetical protein
VLIDVFNGRLGLSKTHLRFKTEWLDNYNSWYRPQIPIPHLPRRWDRLSPSSLVPVDPLNPTLFVGLNDGWLCGFTDADGSFGVSLSQNKQVSRIRISLYWYVDQSYALPDLEMLRSRIGFGYIEPKNSGKSGFTPSEPDQAFRFKTRSLKDNLHMVDYFGNFPPLGEPKATRHLHWMTVVGWCLEGTWQAHLKDIREIIEVNKKLYAKKPNGSLARL